MPSQTLFSLPTSVLKCQIPPSWYPCPYLEYQFSCSVVSNFLATPWTAAHQASLSITNSQSFLKLMSIKSVMPPNCPIPCHPLQPSVFPSIRIFILMSQPFASGDQSIGASASTSVLPINIQDWFPLGLTDLITLQSNGTLRSLLQHHSSKASILWRSAFFMVQLSYPYMTTGKT